jgi:hypothetical protein
MFRAEILWLANGPILKMEGRLVGDWAEQARCLVTCRGATITRLRSCCYGCRSEPLLTQQQHPASTASPCCIRSNELIATGH